MVERSGCGEVASTLKNFVYDTERNIGAAKAKLKDSTKDPANLVMAKAYAEELLEYRKIIPTVADVLFIFEDNNICKEELKPIRLSLRELWETL